jgi:hypothetical protein
MVVVAPLGGHLPELRGNVAVYVTPVVFLEPAGHAISPNTTYDALISSLEFITI